MNEATLVRHETSDEGTFGVLTLDSGLSVKTAELPWRENAPGISCIPEGSYECVWRVSPRFGPCYHVLDVPDRSNILIHAGNYAGDQSRGFRSDVEGCILLGMDFGRLQGQKALVRSRTAIFNFHRALAEAPFTLHVRSVVE